MKLSNYGEFPADVPVIAEDELFLYPFMISPLFLSDESNITGKISEAEIILRLVSSSVGPIHLSLIDELFRLLIDDVLIPLGNHYLDIGYPLPSFHGVHFVNATVEYGADYVALGTSVHAAKLLPALLGA